MKTNYHTHHKYCKHAIGVTEDYVQEALRLGFDVLGMSDHAPTETIVDHADNVRMDAEDLDRYLDEVEKAKRAHKGNLTIYSGLEVEFLEPNPDYYKRLRSRTDYLILGQHYIRDESAQNSLVSSFALKKPQHVIQYAKDVEKAIESGYFSLVGHPDLYLCGYPRFDDAAKKAAHRICKAAKKHNIPLEFNANGIRRGKILTDDGVRYPYPVKAFWDIAREHNCTIMLSSDCHEPSLLYDNAVKEAEAMLKAWNLSTINRLDFK